MQGIVGTLISYASKGARSITNYPIIAPKSFIYQLPTSVIRYQISKNKTLKTETIRIVFIHWNRRTIIRLESLKAHPIAIQAIAILCPHLCHIIGASREASDGISGFSHGDGASPTAVSRGFVSHFPLCGCARVPAKGGRGVGHVAHREAGGGGKARHHKTVHLHITIIITLVHLEGNMAVLDVRSPVVAEVDVVGSYRIPHIFSAPE